jgi:hypothetical protein
MRLHLEARFAECQAFVVTNPALFCDKCVTSVESLNQYNEKPTAPESREVVIKVGLARRMQVSSRRIGGNFDDEENFFYGREPDCTNG